MPQMAPMWWTVIMLTTIMSMILTMMIVYFSYSKMIKENQSEKPKQMNWTW